MMKHKKKKLKKKNEENHYKVLHINSTVGFFDKIAKKTYMSTNRNKLAQQDKIHFEL